jgi:nicotinamide mononucleotide transporter
MSVWEIAGFVTGAWSVWLFVRESVWAWPVGLVNSAAWLVLFWQSRLFLDSGLQVLYLALGVWGWLAWARGLGDGADLPVVRAARRQVVVLAVIATAAWVVLWWAMAWQADAAPFWDAATTVGSLVAQYLMIRKVLGSWWWWIAVDVAYVGIYAVQHLYLTAALQPLFIAMCVAGAKSWRRSMAGTGDGAALPRRSGGATVSTVTS